MPAHPALIASLLAGVLLFGVPLGKTPVDSSPPPPPPEDSARAVVVELFTSEGCSSCPPADRFLRSLVKHARAEDRPVYALSFHVDYWNRLGWQDPYSDASYSRRQQRYVSTLGVDAYTPQIVVDGSEVMVGSRSRSVRQAITAALDDPSAVRVMLDASAAGDSLQLRYRLSGAVSARARLHFALVERGLSQSVPRGENAGRTLRHANVVRQFLTRRVRRRGSLLLPIPGVVDRSQASVIAYVQAPSMTIHGAARVDVPGEDPTSASK